MIDSTSQAASRPPTLGGVSSSRSSSEAPSLLPSFLWQSRAILEQACLANASSSYLGNFRMLCRILGHYLLYCDTRDCAISPHLIMSGYWESWITVLMARLIKPGDT